MRDLHNNINVVTCIAPVAVGTTGTGQTGSVIDCKGYDSVEFVLHYGAITATAATFTPTILHGDATGSMASAAAADLLGTEAAAGLAAAARVDGSTENVAKRIGYIGGKRYVQAKIVSTATAGTPVSAAAVLGNAHRAPVAT